MRNWGLSPVHVGSGGRGRGQGSLHAVPRAPTRPQGLDVRDAAFEALKASQSQLQEELQDAVNRLQAVDRSTGG